MKNSIIPLLLLSLLIIAFSCCTSNDTENQNPWTDMSKMKNSLESKGYNIEYSGPTSLEAVKDTTSTLFVVIGMDKKYSPDQESMISNFVEKGGHVIIADETGNMDSFAEDYELFIYGGPFFADDFEKNANFTVVDGELDMDGDDAIAETETYELLLNHATGIISQDQTVLAHGRPAASYLDMSRDGTISMWALEDPKQGKLADAVSSEGHEIQIATEVLSGQGSIVFVSDTGIFIDDMWDRRDNSKFVLDLVKYLIPKGTDIIMDESRHNSDKSGHEKYDTASTDAAPPLQDMDNDGLPDIKEDYIFGTNASNPDTDGDGMHDGWEVSYMVYNYTSMRLMIDANIPDADEDPDGDEWTNIEEYQAGTDPTDPYSQP